MKLDEFEQALDRYGGDLERWPDELRAEGEALIARGGTAAKAAAHAAQLDGILVDAMKPLPVDAAMIGRILSRLGDAPHREAALRPTPRLAAWAGAAMIAFLSAGYIAGVLLPVSEGSEDTFAGLMFGSGWTTSDTAADDAGSVL